MLVKLCWLIIFIGIVTPAFSQNTIALSSELVPFAGDYRYPKVLCVLQDKLGFLWIGTQNGLYRFDGYESKVFRYDGSDPTSLSYNVVNAIYEDSFSDLWIGTSTGGLNLLNRQSGRFSHFQHDPEKPGSLSDNRIRAISEDYHKNLWIATGDGKINVRAPNSKSFEHITFDPGTPYSLSGPSNGLLYLDNSKNLWIGTSKGIDRFSPSFTENNGKHPTTFPIEHVFHHDPADPHSLSHNFIKSIFEDKQGNLWFCTQNSGLNRLDSQTSKFDRFLSGQDQTKPNAILHVVDANMDHDGRIWIGTHIRGLTWLYPGRSVQGIDQSGTGYFKMGEEKAFPISVNSLSKDRFGNYWAGTNIGLFRWDSLKVEMNHISKPEGSLMRSAAFALSQDQSGKIWHSSMDTLLSYDPKTGKVNRKRLPLASHLNPLGNQITALHADRSGHLWIGTFRNGMYFHNLATGKFRHYDNQPDHPNYLAIRGVIIAICEDQNGDIWVGGFGQALNRINPGTGEIDHFMADPEDPKTLSTTIILDLFEDSQGSLWIGTEGGGLNRMDRETGLFERYLHDTDNPHSLSGHSVSAVVEDRAGNVWVGTTDNGLNFLDRATNQFSQIRESDGLINDIVRDIIVDDNGRFWVCTAKGLSYFSPERIRSVISGRISSGLVSKNEPLVWNMTTLDGLKNHSISRALKSALDSELYFMGEAGIDHFYPNAIRKDTLKPSVVLTFFSRTNSKDKKVETDYFISDQKKTTLSFRNKVLVFKVAALNFRKTPNSHYRYQLEGFSDQWFELGTKREITFTNLDPGPYTLRVMGTNGDGIWNPEPTELDFEILPPWWATWWAYALYAAIILLVLFGGWQFEHRRRMAYAEAQRLKELDTFKTRLYTNITHEFRTPLTIILGMARQIRDNPKEWYTEGLNMITRNGRQLLHLVNQMLDLSRLDKGKLTLHYEHGDVVAFIHYLVQSFESYAAGKNIQIHFLKEIKRCEMDFAPDQLTKIVSNLLSNAVKFTQEGGKIYVIVDSRKSQVLSHLPPKRKVNDLRLTTDYLRLKIKDNGPGIPANALPRIFDRFYQVNPEKNTGTGGVGVGLALTKELIDLMGGRISVESSLDEGSDFCVLLPIKHEAKSPEKKGEKKSQALADNDDIQLQPVPDENRFISEDVRDEMRGSAATPVANFPPPQPSGSDQPTILLIEDNRDVLTYLASCLEADYQLEFAGNGQEGIEHALEIVPDIIISDVMMPEKDGYEVCSTLKEDIRTSHIPIILLTAKGDQDSRIEGLKSGADAYLAKPFYKEELDIRLEKLLELRRQLQARYCNGNPIQAVRESSGTKEDLFLKKVLNIIEAHLSDENFGITQLCRKLSLSRSQVHTKIKALTGKSTSIIIRSVRIEKAKEILKDGDLHISEVAYQVGFRTPVYFTQKFTEEVGVSPSQYRNEN